MAGYKRQEGGDNSTPVTGPTADAARRKDEIRSIHKPVKKIPKNKRPKKEGPEEVISDPDPRTAEGERQEVANSGSHDRP